MHGKIQRNKDFEDEFYGFFFCFVFELPVYYPVKDSGHALESFWHLYWLNRQLRSCRCEL